MLNRQKPNNWIDLFKKTEENSDKFLADIRNRARTQKELSLRGNKFIKELGDLWKPLSALSEILQEGDEIDLSLVKVWHSIYDANLNKLKHTVSTTEGAKNYDAAQNPLIKCGEESRDYARYFQNLLNMNRESGYSTTLTLVEPGTEPTDPKERFDETDQSEIDALHAKISQLRGEMVAKDTQLEVLQREKVLLKEERNILKPLSSNLQVRVNDLERDNKILKAQVDEVKEWNRLLEEHKDQQSRVERELKDVNASLSAKLKQSEIEKSKLQDQFVESQQLLEDATRPPSDGAEAVGLNGAEGARPPVDSLPPLPEWFNRWLEYYQERQAKVVAWVQTFEQIKQEFQESEKQNDEGIGAIIARAGDDVRYLEHIRAQVKEAEDARYAMEKERESVEKDRNEKQNQITQLQSDLTFSQERRDSFEQALLHKQGELEEEQQNTANTRRQIGELKASLSEQNAEHERVKTELQTNLSHFEKNKMTMDPAVVAQHLQEQLDDPMRQAGWPHSLRNFVEGLIDFHRKLQSEGAAISFGNELNSLDRYIYAPPESAVLLFEQGLNTDLVLRQIAALQSVIHSQLKDYGIMPIYPPLGEKFNREEHRSEPQDLIWNNAPGIKHNTIESVIRLGYLWKPENRILRQARVRRFMVSEDEVDAGKPEPQFAPSANMPVPPSEDVSIQTAALESGATIEEQPPVAPILTPLAEDTDSQNASGQNASEGQEKSVTPPETLLAMEDPTKMKDGASGYNESDERPAANAPLSPDDNELASELEKERNEKSEVDEVSESPAGKEGAMNPTSNISAAARLAQSVFSSKANRN